MPRKFISKFTSPPESKFTTQEVFNRVADHLVNQKNRSRIDNKKPAFRGSDGRKCSVGIFIDDKDYLPEMECYGTDLNRMFERYDCLNHMILHIPILLILQRIHDLSLESDFVEEVKPKLRALAEELSLTIPNSIKETIVTSKKES